MTTPEYLKRDAIVRYRTRCSKDLFDEVQQRAKEDALAVLAMRAIFMATPLEYAGKRIGALVLMEYIQGTKKIGRKWICRCDCGQFTAVRTDNLRAGLSKSCGCGAHRWAKYGVKL